MTFVRADARSCDAMRPVSLRAGVAPQAEGSCEVRFGATRVWCLASAMEKAPAWLAGSGKGWVTAQYAMLPRATNSRGNRDSWRDGRAQEISRLVGRALRAGCDLEALAGRAIVVDCDVMEADGSTRAAAITGAWVALKQCCAWLEARGATRKPVAIRQIAATSCGMVGDTLVCDLDYAEDSQARVDGAFVFADEGQALVEASFAAEGAPFDPKRADTMLTMAQAAMPALAQAQRAALQACA